MNYVLVTAARNEETVIRSALESVAAQTRLPERWIIVDDGSTDGTAAVVEEYVKRHSWIELRRRPARANRSFAGKVHAINAALERFDALGVQAELLGNLDADVSFEPDYMEFLLQRFADDARLGVAGTPFTEDGGYDSTRDSFEGDKYVAGPFQLFRFACFRDIGGYVANPAGGVDWIAVMTARMNGWTVRAFPEKRFHHHRAMGTAERGKVAAMFSYGQKDYYLGGSPLWQVFRGAYQTTKRPLVLGGASLLAGYVWASVMRIPRAVSPELMRFHRKEQMRKLKAVFGSLLRFKKVDAFRLENRSEQDHRHGADLHNPVGSLPGPEARRDDPTVRRVFETLQGFVDWLDRFGDTSWDHQSFFAGSVGRRAKSLYYRQKLMGTAAVAPMIFCEAFLPSARRLFHHRTRFPIADAHYAMGFWYLYGAVGDPKYLERAVGYLDALKATRCPGFEEYCWGYPFDWVTRNGTIARQTPLITTTPYAYEAFLLGYELCGREEWHQVLASIARHAFADIKEFKASEDSASCSYTPFDGGGVINAAAYRAFLLTSASKVCSDSSYWEAAERNLNFVLDAQNPDGSWYYAVDGVRDFVDHFHTCFVMKALAKIHTLTGHERCLAALTKGVDYYLTHLFDSDGLPKPFSKAPRLTTYKRELYDCAECINLCLLLKDRFPQLEPTLATVVSSIMSGWVKSDGSFRSRQLLVGWDNVPMHRWAQSQMVRSLAFFVLNARSTAAARKTESPASVDQHRNSPPVHTL